MKDEFHIPLLILISGLLSSCAIYAPRAAGMDPRPGPLEDLLYGISAMRAETGQWPRSIDQLVEAGTIDRDSWWIGVAEIQRVNLQEDDRHARYYIFIHEHERRGVVWWEGIYPLDFSVP